jgi:hypothetical protein
MSKQDQIGNPHEVKKEVKLQDSILMQAQVKQVIFIFIEYTNTVLLRAA